MKTACVFLIFTICYLIDTSRAAPVDATNSPDQSKSAFGPAFDEIVVESSLTVRRKTDPGRQARNKDLAQGVSAKIETGKREKREPQGRKHRPGHNRGAHPDIRGAHPDIRGAHPNIRGAHQNNQGNFGNAPANFGGNPQFGKFPAFPSGGAAQAGAQAQDFNSNGPLGSFGASATGTQTQTLGFGPGGFAGAGGFAMTQQYRLPNGQVVDFTLNNSFSGTNGALAKGGGSSLTISNPKTGR